MSLSEPGVLYAAAKATDLQDVPVMAGNDPDAMLWQEQALKTGVTHPRLSPIVARTGHQYRTTWVKGVPISHKSEVHVHVHHQVGVHGRLAAYELASLTSQLNVTNVHVPFGDATETFIEHLREAYRQLAMTGPTFIIGDFHAAPSMDHRGGRQTPEDTAVQMAGQHMDLQDLQDLLRQPPHRPHAGTTDSRIDLCSADPAHVEVTRARYHDLPSKITGHRPLEVLIRVLQVPPASTKDDDNDGQTPISPQHEDDTHRWTAYYRTVHRILGPQDDTELDLAMQQAAMACGFHRGQRYTQENCILHQDLQSMVTALLRDKRELRTAIHSHDPQTKQDTQKITAGQANTGRQLRELHVCRAKELAQEQQRYFQNPKIYKSLQHVDKVLGEPTPWVLRRSACKTAH